MFLCVRLVAGFDLSVPVECELCIIDVELCPTFSGMSIECLGTIIGISNGIL